MATLTVRQLDDGTYAGLKARAERTGRSMEAEARVILTDSVSEESWVEKWLAAVDQWRGDDLQIPARSLPQEIDLA
jgi:plasmid stability protein